MTGTMHIEIDRAEGSLQRLIGLIERRGFHIEGLTLAGEGERRLLALNLRAHDATRRIDVLGRQIDKLYGVRRFA